MLEYKRVNLLSIYFIINYSDEVRFYLFILSTYLAQLLSVKVLATLPYNTFTTTVIVKVK